MKNNMILIGFMGCGKTTIGKKLADNLGYQFQDTDQRIESEQGCTIKQLFSDKGEEFFRELETQYLKECSEHLEETVLSTGGGTPLRKENMSLLRELGVVIYLRTKKETIYSRVRQDTSRPLLQCSNPMDVIESMLTERGPIYEEMAHVIIDTDELNACDVVAELIEQLAEKNYL